METWETFRQDREPFGGAYRCCTSCARQPRLGPHHGRSRADGQTHAPVDEASWRCDSQCLWDQTYQNIHVAFVSKIILRMMVDDPTLLVKAKREDYSRGTDQKMLQYIELKKTFLKVAEKHVPIYWTKKDLFEGGWILLTIYWSKKDNILNQKRPIWRWLNSTYMEQTWLVRA